MLTELRQPLRSVLHLIVDNHSHSPLHPKHHSYVHDF